LLGIEAAIGFPEILCRPRADTGILGPGIGDYESRLHDAVDNNRLVVVFARAALYIIQLYFGPLPVNGNRQGKGRGNRGAAAAGGVDAEVVGSLIQLVYILPVTHTFRQFVKVQGFAVLALA